MHEKITDFERRLRILTHLRRRIKKIMYLFPSESSTFDLLHKMSDDLKAHINAMSTKEE